MRAGTQILTRGRGAWRSTALLAMAACAVGIAVGVAAADLHRLAGSYGWRGATAVDPPAGEMRDTHMVFRLEGSAARELYDRLAVVPVRDACLADGSLTRQRGALQCTRHAQAATYTCDFAVDARSGRLAAAAVC